MLPSTTTHRSGLFAEEKTANAVITIWEVLKESQKVEKQYHEATLAALQEQHLKLKNRIDAMQADKLDGKISQDFYNAKTVEMARPIGN